MATTKRTASQDQRWNFRVASGDDDLVRAAAEAAETSVTSFVTRAAVVEAQRVLADRREFHLDEPDWDRFNELLDRPAQIPPGLEELFSKPSVFERD